MVAIPLTEIGGIQGVLSRGVKLFDLCFNGIIPDTYQ
jgi:hypothetical protein